MIKQGMLNDSILEKKFKILRTSLMLGNVKNREEMLSSYEETAREIDNVRRGVYEEILAGKMYTTTTLEEERDRLSDLINLTEKRVKERNDFIDDYIKVTSNFLDDLPRVSNEEELPQYKDRFDTINEYLSNSEEIERLNKKLKEKRQELEEKYENKASNELINTKLENELIDQFNKVMADDEYYTSLNYTDIDNELVKIESNLEEKKNVMNTFISSYEALNNAGISGSEKEEYLSYVNDAKADYYNELERKFILNIYKLVLDKESDYDLLYQKRLFIENILNDRLKNRQELGITSRDRLEYFSNICKEQFSIIKSQKLNNENIERIIVEITDCENKLEELDKANNRVQILDLLNEFSTAKPEIEKIEMPVEKEVYEEVVKQDIINNGGPKPSNMVVSINEPVKINVKNATDTAKLVMKKVVIVLEPKRFNNKKDKLKEAERELEEIKQREEQEKIPVVQLDNSSYKNNSKEELFDDKINSNEKEIKTLETSSNIFDSDETFVTLDANNDTMNTNDDVFVNPDLNINLDTKEVEGMKDTYTPDGINLNVPSNDVTIPTEIYIEEPPVEKKPDLFSQTDPFLDDNIFEIENSNSNKQDVASNMPKIVNIGTVRPNSMLAKINDAVEENKDIVLPTMGLASDNKTNVPIVSENYIN